MASATGPAAGSSPALRIDLNSEPAKKNLDVTRIVVKSTAAKQTPARSEEAAQLPNPLAVGTSSESALSSLTAPSIRSQPSLVKVNISQGVSQGLLIKRVQPRYPQNALAMHLQGAVQLGAMIDKEGKIVNLQVLKGDVMLARAAMDAVRQWRYKPYYLDGVPVDIETQITVNFRLPN
jgi:TonB family protein